MLDPDSLVIASTGQQLQHSSSFYLEASVNRSAAMNAVLWSDTAVAWVDYNLTAAAASGHGITTIASYIPLWAGILDFTDPATLPERQAVYDSFVQAALVQPGGVLTSTEVTGEQWDAPNAWPPLVWFTVEGLVKLAMPESIALAVSSVSFLPLFQHAPFINQCTSPIHF